MKTNFFILLFLVLGCSAFANGTPTVLSVDSKTLVVDTKEWKSEKVHIQIKEASGAVIFEETVLNKKNQRKYNLKKLPRGLYSIEIENKLKIAVQSFEVSYDDITVSSEIDYVYKPVVIVHDDFMDVNLLTQGYNALINILDASNNIVFSERITDPVVHTRYNVASLESGEYSVQVALDGRSFVQKIQL